MIMMMTMVMVVAVVVGDVVFVYYNVFCKCF